MSAIQDQLSPPTEEMLRETALRHLARFAATEQGLAQFLDRVVRRWARRKAVEGFLREQIEVASEQGRSSIALVIANLRRIGALDDAAFARARALSLTRSGRSRRAVAAKLSQKGIDRVVLSGAIAEVLGGRDEENSFELELAAALVLARKRRLGPFCQVSVGGEVDKDLELHQRALAVFARAGFSRDVAEKALALDPVDAENRVIALKLL